MNIEFAEHLPKVKRAGFLNIPNDIFDTNIFALISGRALLLYLLLVRRSFNGSGYIYTNQVTDGTNIDKKHMARYFDELENLHLIVITESSKKHSYKRYRINTLQDTNIKRDVKTLKQITNSGESKCPKMVNKE